MNLPENKVNNQWKLFSTTIGILFDTASLNTRIKFNLVKNMSNPEIANWEMQLSTLSISSQYRKDYRKKYNFEKIKLERLLINIQSGIFLCLIYQNRWINVKSDE